MHTRRRALVKVKSKDDEPNKWVSPRKRGRTNYTSTNKMSDPVLSSEQEDKESEESEKEMSPKSADRGNADKEAGAEEEPEATKTKNVAFDLVSFVSQRKPILILHKIEGDFHLLLNDVELLQNGGRPASQKDHSEEKTSQDDAPDPVGETAVQEEDEQETSQNNSDHENHEQDPDSRPASLTGHTEHQVSAGEDEAPQPVEDEAPQPVEEEEAPQPLEEEAPQPLEEAPQTVEEAPQAVGDEALQPVEDEAPQPVEEAPQPVEASDVQGDEKQDNVVEEVELMPMEEAAVTRDQGCGTTTLQEHLEVKNEVEIVAPILCFDLESVEAAATLPDVILQDSEQEPPDERPREENPAAAAAEAAVSPELEVMDLEQLKREKVKWQIKVLKLQGEYYSLQLLKLKQ